MRPTSTVLSFHLIIITSAVFANLANATTSSIVDGEGFESPAYDTAFLGTGQLEGQFASTDGGFGSVQWTQSPVGGMSTAVVQDSVKKSGDQAVRVDRGSNSDDRWAVFQTGFPTERFICIEWDMRVDETVLATGFGPFFGVEAYDDDATSLLRIGSLGVDAATSEILYTDRDFGLIPTPGGDTVNFGEWNSFRMILDFAAEKYYGIVNNIPVLYDDFEFPGVNAFTDADIAAIAASFDLRSQAATGTAYFDNFVVFETDDITGKIPEPSTLTIMLFGLFGIVTPRRR